MFLTVELRVNLGCCAKHVLCTELHSRRDEPEALVLDTVTPRYQSWTSGDHSFKTDETD